MKMETKVTKDILIEDLVEEVPAAITYLMEKGIRCLRCGEPTWGTLNDAAKEKGFNDDQIETFVKEINELAEKQ